MNIEILNQKYRELKNLEDTDDGIFEFKNLLLADDEEETLNFHYDILSDRDDEYLHRDIFSFFKDRKNKSEVCNFLLNKYYNGIDDDMQKADIIQILGNLKSKNAEKIALENITSSNLDIRYRCIIVLGWVGTSNTLPVLNERMLNDNDGQLRGYAATAMRQIWFNHPATKEQITVFIRNAISTETDERALIGMIITIQELYRKKLGLKESAYGDVSGNIQEAKEKTIKLLFKI